jgi:hypothetical protein
MIRFCADKTVSDLLHNGPYQLITFLSSAGAASATNYSIHLAAFAMKVARQSNSFYAPSF